MKMEHKWLEMDEVEALYGLDMETEKVLEQVLDKGYLPVAFEDGKWKVMVIPKMFVKALAAKYNGDVELMKKDLDAAMGQFKNLK